jgi:hypothetical protein
VDDDPALIAALNAGRVPGESDELGKSLARLKSTVRLRFADPANALQSDTVHVLAIEPTFNVNGTFNLSALETAIETMGRRLRGNDLVLVTANLPVGTVRGLVRRMLEQISGLQAGDDFALAATLELYPRNQYGGPPSVVVSGITPRCTALAIAFWRSLRPVIIPVERIEAAELAALAGGTLRDLNAAFASDVVAVARRYNIDINALAATIERGESQTAAFLRPRTVERNQDSSAALLVADGEIGGRKVGLDVYPADAVARFASRCNRPVSEMNVAIFSGAEPDAMAFSTIAERRLMQSGAKVHVVLSGAADDVKAALANADVFLNFIREGASDDLRPPPAAAGVRRLVFDAFSSLDRTAIESIPNCIYATFGYMTAPKIAVIACDNGFGHVRRCAAIAAALRDRGATCDLFAPAHLASRLDGPIIEFRTHSTPTGWRAGADDTVDWQDRLPDLEPYDFVLADSLPEILERRSDAILIGHFLWTQVLPDANSAHVARIEKLLERYRPQMLGTGFLASDSLKAKTSYIDVGFFGAAEFDFLPAVRNDLLISSGRGAEDDAGAPLRKIVEVLAAGARPPAPFNVIHVEPSLLPTNPPRWMVPASYAPAMYRGLAAAILRPGAGTITECVCRAVWMIWPEASDNEEIARNASELAAKGLAEIAPTPQVALDLAQAFADDPKRASDLLARCRALRFNGAASVANLLLDDTRPNFSARGLPTRVPA